MKVLLVHNFYQQPGGEDVVFADEAGLLADHGHKVLRYTVHNDAIKQMNSFRLVGNTFWNRTVYTELRALMRRERPDVMHCTNTFPLISPAAYYAARAEQVPVVQTLHNYRLLCLNALFLRDGLVCEDCLGKRVAWPGVRHRCYRDSRAASAVVAALQSVHRVLGTWSRLVDVYVALTEFARQKFINGGLPAHKLVVKPNFVSPDRGAGTGDGGYALFVGRLSAQKGIETLLSAWSSDAGLPPLRIVGDGELAEKVREAASKNRRIEWLGQRPGGEVQYIMSRAAMLVFTSLSYEGLPKTIVESFCHGTPVVASSVGAMPELIEEGRTGLLFELGNARALARAVADLAARPERLAEMRREARAAFLASYTAERNYQLLAEIYVTVLRARGNHAAVDELLHNTQRHLCLSQSWPARFLGRSSDDDIAQPRGRHSR
jgi:glycosyltransferase involved in cell wall biosynthesis